MPWPWVETGRGERKGPDYIDMLYMTLIDRTEIAQYHNSGLDDSVDGGLICQANIENRPYVKYQAFSVWEQL